MCEHKMSWGNIQIECSLPEGHEGNHSGRYLQTDIYWMEGDRRDYVGELRHCVDERCILPGGHWGNHAY